MGESAWVIPTSAGLRAAGQGFGVWRPGLACSRTSRRSTMCACTCRPARRETEWVPSACSRASARAGEHLPDAVVIADGQRVAIEVELTVKNSGGSGDPRRAVGALRRGRCTSARRDRTGCSAAARAGGGRRSACATCATQTARRVMSAATASSAACSLAGAADRLRRPGRRGPAAARVPRTRSSAKPMASGVSRWRCVSVASARCRSTAGWCCSPRTALPAPAGVRSHRQREDRDGAAVGVDAREVVATPRCSIWMGRAIGRPRAASAG